MGGNGPIKVLFAGFILEAYPEIRWISA